MGTKDEICNLWEIRGNCTYKCHTETFEKLLNDVTEHEPEIFEDKYHGLLVATKDKFSNVYDAETYVKRRYGNNW